MNISVVKHVLSTHDKLAVYRDMSAVDLVFMIEAYGIDREVWCANTSDLCEPLSIVLGSLSRCM